MRKIPQPQNPNPTDLRVQRRHKEREGKVERDAASSARVLHEAEPRTCKNSIQANKIRLFESRRKKERHQNLAFSAKLRIKSE
jgi:hypothetical protein